MVSSSHRPVSFDTELQDGTVLDVPFGCSRRPTIPIIHHRPPVLLPITPLSLAAHPSHQPLQQQQHCCARSSQRSFLSRVSHYPDCTFRHYIHIVLFSQSCPGHPQRAPTLRAPASSLLAASSPRKRDRGGRCLLLPQTSFQLSRPVKSSLRRPQHHHSRRANLTQP